MISFNRLGAFMADQQTAARCSEMCTSCARSRTVTRWKFHINHTSVPRRDYDNCPRLVSHGRLSAAMASVQRRSINQGLEASSKAKSMQCSKARLMLGSNAKISPCLKVVTRYHLEESKLVFLRPGGIFECATMCISMLLRLMHVAVCIQDHSQMMHNSIETTARGSRTLDEVANGLDGTSSGSMMARPWVSGYLEGRPRTRASKPIITTLRSCSGAVAHRDIAVEARTTSSKQQATRKDDSPAEPARLDLGNTL